MAAEEAIFHISNDVSHTDKMISVGGGNYFRGVARMARALDGAKKAVTNMFFMQGDDTVGADTLFKVTFDVYQPIQIMKIYYYNNTTAGGILTGFKVAGELVAPAGWDSTGATNWTVAELFSLDDIGWDLFIPGSAGGSSTFSVEGTATNGDVVTIGILGYDLTPKFI